MHFAAKKVYAKQTPNRFKNVKTEAKKKPKANTNIISIDLGELSEKVTLMTGDPTSCSNCEAIFNSNSVTTFGIGGEPTWTCEFCGTQSVVQLEEEEIPKTETLDYMLEPAEEIKESNSDSTIIFCIDISGSMCVTTEVVGKLNLKGDRVASTDLNALSEGRADQYLPGQRRDVTYVSRLQCVQAAIESQIENIVKTHPLSKIGLICFNNEVLVYGDGTGQPAIVTGDKLFDTETLLNTGNTYKIDKPISQTKDALIQKLYQLNECGSTALGPAVAVAIGMVRDSPGSRIVVATDGLANMGVGSLDAKNLNENVVFYEQMGELSKGKGVVISVIGIQGDAINMNTLGKLAEATNGDVDIVDPLNITKNFATILKSKLIATDVNVKLFLHKGFSFPDSDEWKISDQQGEKKQLYASRFVGNSYEDTEITAEFTQASAEVLAQIFADEEKADTMEIVGEKEKEKEEEKEKESKTKELPFQVQITYRALSGMKCTRVITKKKEITSDRAEVEKDIDIAVLGMHANFKTAALAQKGCVDDAITKGEMYAEILERNVNDSEDSAGYNIWVSDTRNFNNQMRQQQQLKQPQPPPQPQPLPSQNASTFSFGSIGGWANSFFGGSAAPSPALGGGGGGYGAPPPSNSLPFAPSSGFSFRSNATAPSSSPVLSPSQQQQQEDQTATAIYQRLNHQKNKKQWADKRKY